MLTANLLYIYALIVGFALGYTIRLITHGSKPKKKPTPAESDSGLEEPKPVEDEKGYDHLVEVNILGEETYTYMTVTIDGVVGGKEKTFISYGLRDAMKAHALITYDDTFDHDGKGRFEAIGVTRKDGVYTINGRRYKIIFRQPGKGGMVSHG